MEQAESIHIKLITKKLDDTCLIEFGTRVVQKKDGGAIYSVFGGGGATFKMDTYNRENCLVVSRFALSKKCTRFVSGKFYLNDSGLTIKTKNGKELAQEYLDYLLLALNDTIYSLSRGTAQRNLNVSKFRNIEIQYPDSIDAQLHIAHVLSKAENLIAQRKESIRLLDEFLKSTFLEMFGDPVRNEKGWELYPFSELVANDCPLTYGIVQPGNEFPNGVPIIRPVDLTQTIITRKGLKRIDPKISEKFKRTVLKGGELLMCVRGTTGIVSIASNELAGCNVTRGITPIWFSENYNSLFAYGLLQTQAVINRIQELTYGATLKQINLGDLRKIDLIKPSLELQKQFAKIVEKTEALKAQYRQSLRKLENLYGSLSQRAFRGELSLKNERN